MSSLHRRLKRRGLYGLSIPSFWYPKLSDDSVSYSASFGVNVSLVSDTFTATSSGSTNDNRVSLATTGVANDSIVQLLLDIGAGAAVLVYDGTSYIDYGLLCEGKRSFVLTLSTGFIFVKVVSGSFSVVSIREIL